MAGVPLVTGATGFAGSHLLDQLVQLAGPSAVEAWAHRGGRTAAERDADPRARWSAVDLLDRDAVREALAGAAPSVIYHCAGVADVHASWHSPARALRVNVLGTEHLLAAARELNLSCPVVVTSSALVYRPSARAIAETDPVAPSSPYGVSKLGQELVARQSYGRVIVARAFNHAGPRQDASYVTSAFARQLAEIEAGAREPVLLVGNLDSRRDITDVRDTVRAYRLLAAHGRPDRPYNVCSGRAYRVGDLLEILLGRTRTRVQVTPDPTRTRPHDNPIVLGDPSRIAADTGWRAEIPIERTLADLLDYWRAALNPAQPRPA